jgi:cytochrome c-type biogenesis protein
LFVAIFGSVVQAYLFSLMPLVGGILLILGLSILMGFDHYLEMFMELIKKPFQKASAATGIKGEGSGAFGLFAYGFGYGAAASSCMAPLFIAVMLLGLSTGLIGGGLIFLIYAVSLGAMMVTISLLVSSSEGLINKLVSSMGVIKKISGALLVMTGCFVVWYFFFGYKVFSGILSF